MEQIKHLQDTPKIVIVGHVDHGKSSLIGRLMYELDQVPEGKYEELKNFLELELNYKISKNISLLPRTGETGSIGFGYDMFIMAKKF